MKKESGASEWGLALFFESLADGGYHRRNGFHKSLDLLTRRITAILGLVFTSVR